VKKKVVMVMVDGKKTREVGEISLLQPASCITFIGEKLCVASLGAAALYEWGPQPTPEVRYASRDCMC
jgi:hypothetical protein